MNAIRTEKDHINCSRLTEQEHTSAAAILHFATNCRSVSCSCAKSALKRFSQAAGREPSRSLSGRCTGRKKQFPHIKNVLCMPFESYGRSWNRDGAFGKDDLEKMKALADRIDVVTEGTPTKRDISQTITECNRCMVDHADIVLGVTWEREFLKGDGGTAECLRYAVQADREVRVIHPTDREMTQFEVLKLSPCEKRAH